MAKLTFDDRVAKLAASLLASGVVNPQLVAYGLTAKLRRYCWSNHTDMLGTADDVEALVGLRAKPSVAEQMFAARLLGRVKGRYYSIYALIEAPAYIKKRWGQQRPESYGEAKLRAASRQDIVTATPTLGVFADALEDKTDGKGTPGHKELVDFFHEAWQERYGAKYPWQKKDFAHIRAVIRLTETIDAAKCVLRAYLRESSAFYAGHRLGKLLLDFPRFAAAAIGDSGTTKYARSDEPLPPV